MNDASQLYKCAIENKAQRFLCKDELRGTPYFSHSGPVHIFDTPKEAIAFITQNLGGDFSYYKLVGLAPVDSSE